LMDQTKPEKNGCRGPITEGARDANFFPYTGEFDSRGELSSEYEEGRDQHNQAAKMHEYKTKEVQNELRIKLMIDLSRSEWYPSQYSGVTRMILAHSHRHHRCQDRSSDCLRRRGSQVRAGWLGLGHRDSIDPLRSGPRRDQHRGREREPTAKLPNSPTDTRRPRPRWCSPNSPGC
jgi:hypothetical protein